jgi:hypothetical protein
MSTEIKLCIKCKLLKYSIINTPICTRYHPLTGIPINLSPEHQRSNSWFNKCGKKARYFIPKED